MAVYFALTDKGEEMSAWLFSALKRRPFWILNDLPDILRQTHGLDWKAVIAGKDYLTETLLVGFLHLNMILSITKAYQISKQQILESLPTFTLLFPGYNKENVNEVLRSLQDLNLIKLYSDQEKLYEKED